MMLQPLALNTAMPAEIWMHVAQFIPHSDLCSMFSVNHVFFQLSMDARYRELRFETESEAEALWRLQRARDPSISRRVRHLYIDLRRGFRFVKQFDMDGTLRPGWTGISFLDGIQIMTETITYLINVTEFSLKWEHPRSDDHLVPLLIAAWKSFGHGLRKLFFIVSLYNLAALLSTVDGLVSLRDLDVTVNGKHMATEPDKLATALPPFVNKVAPTLHSLSFCSILCESYVPPFFHEFSNIPNLEKLCVKISDGLDPCSVTRFICNHATTLHHLEWDQWCRLSPTLDFTDWVGENNLEEAFSNLHTLRIRVPKDHHGCLAMLVEHIMLSANTLTSLGLLGCKMTYEEVNTLMSLFAPNDGRNLKELGFSIEYLSPELVLLLAQTLPRLEKLTIHIVYVTGHKEEKRTAGTSTVREERLHAGMFADAMRTYDFRGWALRDVLLTSLDTHLSEQLMWVLAECVPSLQKFEGKDKEFHAIPHEDRL